MRTIAVLNQKGGVGKTTTTVNIAAALAAMGLKVIVIDLDPQAHLTIHLGVEPQTIRTGSYEVLTQSAGFEQSLMMTRPNLWLLGANINLVGAETELVTVVGREIILREAMQASQERFDFCLIDCAPSLGLLSLNALATSQEVLIPLQPHFLALQGFGKLLQTVDLVNKRINPDIKVTGVLLCMFDTRASLPNEVRADIEHFLNSARGSDSAWSEAKILPTFIRRNIKLAEAPSYGRTIFEYDPTCNGAVDYKNVARFFVGLEPEVQIATEFDVTEEPQAVPESASPESEHQEVAREPEPVTGPQAGFDPQSHEIHPQPEHESMPAPEPVAEPGSPEDHGDPVSTNGPDPTAPEHQREQAPFRIQEFQSPAPPLQSFPVPKAEPPTDSNVPDDTPDETGDAWDEPRQIGV
ncbi:MAG: ParA family protein [Planctomycetota bacterium]